MNGKIRIGVLFGGRSGEHEVSLMSARSVLSVLNPEKYIVTEIGITHDGRWLSGDHPLEAFEKGDTKRLFPVTLRHEPGDHTLYALRSDRLEAFAELDIIFPVLHGTFGEDGTLQGLLEMADMAYVGAGVLGSSVGMDKSIFKDIMRTHGIPVVPSIIVNRADITSDMAKTIAAAEALSTYPIFVKPANLGSSVGITKCRNRSDLGEGLMEACRFDRRILIEHGLNAREIEVSVLGNDDPKASIPGEIIPGGDFYDYTAKYMDESSQLLIPAPITDAQADLVRKLAVNAYVAADVAGMARVDFLLDKDTGEVYLNEVNTIPGFTKISMYPKLWEATGLPYSELVDRLVALGLERKADRDRTEHEYRRDA
ncbi:MAG TPA: D-alanine--D-alanine ligase family protein [Longilinea sp.]|nr:D-alanine--D-alanine ligase family protein [Longilinea sp.]